MADHENGRRLRMVTISVHTRKGGFSALITTPDGEFKGFGRTEETATLDAFAVWRVHVARDVGGMLGRRR